VKVFEQGEIEKKEKGCPSGEGRVGDHKIRLGDLVGLGGIVSKEQEARSPGNVERREQWRETADGRRRGVTRQKGCGGFQGRVNWTYGDGGG